MANAWRNAIYRNVLAMLISLSAASAVHGQWTAAGISDSQESILPSATISALAVDPNDPGRILVAADGLGIFRSVDGGHTLHPVDNSNAALRSSFTFLQIDPANPETAYAGGFDLGVVKTIDGGDHWTSAGLEGLGLRTLVIDPTQPETLYAGYASRHWRGAVFKSTDSASNWDSGHLAEAIYAVLVDQLHPATLYAGSDFDFGSYYPEGGGIFRSDDAGTSWRRLPTRFDSVVRALAMDPFDSSKLYAGTSDGLSISTDAGSSWSAVQSLYIARHSVRAIVVDPRGNGRVYAATDKGVRQSSDGGATWTMLGSGGPGILPVRSLALSSDGRRLYAGTEGNGLFTYEMGAQVPAPPCGTDSLTLCLLGGRFEIGAVAFDFRRNETRPATPVAQGDRFGYFSLPDFTGDPTLPEIVVKMVDAADTGRSFWFFYSGLTSLPYTITVRDTETSEIRLYSSEGFCGGADTSAFQGGSAPAPQEAATADSSTPAGSQLWLLGHRFLVTLVATNPRSGETAPGASIPQNDRFGFFSLPDFTGDPSFPEVFVKIIDGTSLPGGTFWVFHTGLTNLSYILTVTDTVGQFSKVYTSDTASSFCGEADTRSFILRGPKPTD